MTNNEQLQNFFATVIKENFWNQIKIDYYIPFVYQSFILSKESCMRNESNLLLFATPPYMLYFHEIETIWLLESHSKVCLYEKEKGFLIQWKTNV